MKAGVKLQFIHLNGPYMIVYEYPSTTRSTTLDVAVEILKHFEVR